MLAEWDCISRPWHRTRTKAHICLQYYRSFSYVRRAAKLLLVKLLLACIFWFSNRPFLNGRQCCIAREHVVKVHISFRFFIFSNECIYFQIEGVELWASNGRSWVTKRFGAIARFAHCSTGSVSVHKKKAKHCLHFDLRKWKHQPFPGYRRAWRHCRQ